MEFVSLVLLVNKYKQQNKQTNNPTNQQINKHYIFFQTNRTPQRFVFWLFVYDFFLGVVYSLIYTFLPDLNNSLPSIIPLRR